MGNFLSKALFGSRKSIDLDKIRQYQQNSQSIVDSMGSNINEQIGLSRTMMDPNSQQNQMMRSMMSQNQSQVGAQIGGSMEKMGAMRNMSPAQIMMQSRMGQNQAMGGVGDKWQQMMQQRFGQGMGLMSGMIGAQGNQAGMQQGLDENMSNAYVGNIAAHNANRSQNIGNMVGLAKTAIGGIGGYSQG